MDIYRYREVYLRRKFSILIKTIRAGFWTISISRRSYSGQVHVKPLHVFFARCLSMSPERPRLSIHRISLWSLNELCEWKSPASCHSGLAINPFAWRLISVKKHWYELAIHPNKLEKSP